MDTKHCKRCETTKPAAEFQPNKAQPSGLQTYCRECTREYRNTARCKEAAKRAAAAWYSKNAEKERAKAIARYHQNPEPFRARRRKANMTPEQYQACKLDVTTRARAIKEQVFAHYGRTCACCGESEPGFLTIDHVNGCGREVRKEHGLGSTFYRWLRKSRFPEGFQTLCYNCNMGRAKNGGVCPHEAARVAIPFSG